jgi:hypothetical protein
MNPTLSRTSSVASVTSDDATTPLVLGNEVKRTRKRFTQAQIVKLEQLFHETSHPTREQRESLANGSDLYVFFCRPLLWIRVVNLGLLITRRRLTWFWGVDPNVGNCDRSQSGSKTNGKRNGNPR